MRLPPLDAYFHAAPDGGQRLHLLHTPPDGVVPRGAVLYVHPWAEEMNKSRRMAALTSRSLAAHGFTVLQIDLAGCGDSSGDFGEAHWDQWVDDVVRSARWLQQRETGDPLWLWGLRGGALLCCAAAAQLTVATNLLFWQPVQQGKAILQQFMRLKAASQLADGGAKAILDAVRADLAAGRAVEIAGYVLSPAMAAGLEAAVLTPLPAATPGQRLAWLEVSAQPDPAASPAAQAAWSRWQAAGWQLYGQAVSGPAFWQTTEIEDAPALITATISALMEGAA